MIRLVAGFLAVFVLLSAAPALPEAVALLQDPVLTEVWNEMLPFILGGVALAIGSIALLRAARHRPAKPVRPSAPARPSRPPLPARVSRSEPKLAISPLALEIRQAARQGGRVSELARRFRTSQDAIRIVMGREGVHSAAPEGSSFRPRQAALPSGPVAKALPHSRSRSRVSV
jgi:hypothetical protein